ncbi:MAG: NUDIX domain-containing protein [Chloroflexi bacterium]|nr:NUDIX domain-containing protein [Chloroflexota bacterium]
MRFNWRDPALKLLLVYWRVVRPRTVGVRGIVQDEQGRVLFVRHSYGDRCWFLPGGGGAGDESADESMRREMREETGLEVEITRLVGVYLWTEMYKRDHIFVFECKSVGGKLRIQRGEIDEYGWFWPDEPPEPLNPGTRAALADWRSGRTGYGRWGEA